MALNHFRAFTGGSEIALALLFLDSFGQIGKQISVVDGDFKLGVD